MRAGAWLLGVAVSASATFPPAHAQDRFDVAPAGTVASSAPAMPSPEDAAEGHGAPGAPSSAANDASAETRDYGVPAQDALRPSGMLHAPTPISIPGGRTIDTATLAALLRDPQRRPLLFHVLGSAEHLPGAIAAAPAGMGGRFEDESQREFGRFLHGVSQGDASKAMVFYCAGTHCWMSYNAALRAMHLGYRNVAWYRGGIEAWRSAGLPVEGAGAVPARDSGSDGNAGPPP